MNDLLFWILALAIGAGPAATITGRVQQANFEQDQIDAAQADLEAQHTLAIAEAELLADQRAFLIEQTIAETEMLRDQAVFALEQAAVAQEQIGVARAESNVRQFQLGDQAATSLATQSAVGAAGGFTPGASFEAVRAKFERSVATAGTAERQRGDVARQRGELAVTGQELQAEQLEIQAELRRTGGGLDADALTLQREGVLAEIESGKRQFDLLTTQEDAITSNLVFGIIGDITSFGISFATSGLVQPNFGNTQGNVALPSFSPTVNQGFNFSMFGPGSNRR